jgi:hypothetical protein
MIVGNTVTVDREIVLDAGDGALVVTTYRVSLHYDDGDSGRDVTAVLDGALGAAIFDMVEALAKADLGGRAEVLTAVAADAVALAKEVR